MKFKIKHLWMVLLALTVLLFTACDGKTPDKGYLTDEQVTAIVEKFSSTADYSTYSYESSFNYLGLDSSQIDFRPSRNNVEFIDSLELYDSKASVSHFLRLPLHITLANWTYYDELMESASDSTKVKIESLLLTYGETLDKVYFYTDVDGNLIIKTFGANKGLNILKGDVICHGKWNVTLVYNKDGYLMSEKFETINTHKEPKTETCYGEATYKYAA